MSNQKLLVAALTLAAFYGLGRLVLGAQRAAQSAGSVPAAPVEARPTPVAAPAPARAPAPAPPQVARRAPAPAPAPRPAPPAARPPAPAAPRQIWRVRIDADDATLGPPSAPVQIVLFSAFGCPECARFAPNVKKAVEKYGDSIRWVFKQKVLPTPHPDALLAAQASLAANAQGKFWAFHDLLMAQPMNIGRPALEAAARSLGLNMKKFKRALDKETYRAQVLRDSLHAYEVAAHSFPNILANGVRIDKSKDWPALQRLIDGELDRAKAEMAKGIKQPELYQKLVAKGRFFEQLEAPTNVGSTDGSPRLGPANAPVQLTVYEDFQCPFCARLAPNLKVFLKRYPKKVSLVYKHLPLDIHDHAKIAAEASMAAAAQGKFWEMHDILFQNQQALARPQLEQYAQRLGLDMERFQADLDRNAYQALINRDAADARRAGVTGTPTLFINGRKYKGPPGYPPEALEAIAVSFFGLKK